MSTGSVKRIL